MLRKSNASLPSLYIYKVGANVQQVINVKQYSLFFGAQSISLVLGFEIITLVCLYAYLF